MFEIFSELEKQVQNEQASSDSGSTNQGSGILVLSVGGSLFFDEKPLTAQIAKFCESILRLHAEGHKFVLVVGGGKVARSYVSAAKSFGATNYSQDELGIMVTRANAFVFVQALEKAHAHVLTDASKAVDVLSGGEIPVFGGLLPSFTTDAVAALISEAVDGVFVNLTDVDGVYSSDPKRSSNAKFYPEISYEKLLSMVKLSASKPGQNMVLDLPCVNILRRSQIKGIVLNGNDLENFKAMVRGQEFKGTLIQSSLAETDEVDA